jgi:hypothetical protein
MGERRIRQLHIIEPGDSQRDMATASPSYQQLLAGIGELQKLGYDA